MSIIICNWIASVCLCGVAAGITAIALYFWNQRRGAEVQTQTLLSNIKTLAASGALLPNVKFQLLTIEGVGSGPSEIVSITFSVAEKPCHSEDATGIRYASGSHSDYGFTFTADRSLEDNLKDLKDFYERNK